MFNAGFKNKKLDVPFKTIQCVNFPVEYRSCMNDSSARPLNPWQKQLTPCAWQLGNLACLVSSCGGVEPLPLRPFYTPGGKLGNVAMAALRCTSESTGTRWPRFQTAPWRSISKDNLAAVGRERDGGCSAYVNQRRDLFKSNLVWDLCEKIFPKSAKVCKISKNVENRNYMISICYCKLRRLGSSEALTSNP